MPSTLDVVSVGDAAAPAAVIAHGSASTAAFVVRVFAGPLAAAGLRLVTWDRRARPSDAVDELAALVETTGATVVGGISVGGLIAAHYAVSFPELRGLLLALPPWLGRPDDIAQLSAAAADDVATNGLPAVLARMATDAPPWVAAEVDEAWRLWAALDEHALVDELRATAATTGPTASETGGCTVPTGIAGFSDDPLHPADAARAWAAALPRSSVVLLSRDAAAVDRGVIGAAAVSAWRRALSEPR